jgi:DNA modification methylase
MSVKILIGDCRERLRELPDASVNCCVTSPPYFGLRDYGTAQWDGGEIDCPHEPTAEWISRKSTANAALGGGTANMGAAAKGRFYNADGSCPCGATRIDRQMGLEPTPDEFVAGMVEVFREVRRVLRDDGTLWLNIGDSYAGSWGARGRGEGTNAARPDLEAKHGTDAPNRRVQGCKPKDLIGIPWMLAFALRADGWYLRQDIIWSKPNPMPESVRDRCTKAHEYLFLLSKSPVYFYDQDAIAEPLGLASVRRLAQDTVAQMGSDRVPGKTNGTMKAVGRRAAGNKTHKYETAYNEGDEVHRTKAGLVGFAERERAKVEAGDLEGTRNKRSVWEVATQPFSEAHFATYPPALIEPCILAGCPKGGTVLDPFGGAGTTGLVADRLGRNAVLIELNAEYAAIAERRLNADAGLFAEVKAA